MFATGSYVQAQNDHFDDEFGDIYIEAGDKFEVIESDPSKLKLKPLNEAKYFGEREIKSTVDLFEQVGGA